MQFEPARVHFPLYRRPPMAAVVSRLSRARLIRPLQLLCLPRRALSTQQPVQYTGKGLSEEVFADVERRDATLREKYDALPTAFPAESQPPQGHIDRVEAFRKRLLYRSKQRGWYAVRRMPLSSTLCAPSLPDPLGLKWTCSSARGLRGTSRACQRQSSRSTRLCSTAKPLTVRARHTEAASCVCPPTWGPHSPN